MVVEKIKTAMYFYFDRLGNKLWTSNETLAVNRAKAHDSEVFKVEIESEVEVKQETTQKK